MVVSLHSTSLRFFAKDNFHWFWKFGISFTDFVHFWWRVVVFKHNLHPWGFCAKENFHWFWTFQSRVVGFIAIANSHQLLCKSYSGKKDIFLSRLVKTLAHLFSFRGLQQYIFKDFFLNGGLPHGFGPEDQSYNVFWENIENLIKWRRGNALIDCQGDKITGTSIPGKAPKNQDPKLSRGWNTNLFPEKKDAALIPGQNVDACPHRQHVWFTLGPPLPLTC